MWKRWGYEMANLPGHDPSSQTSENFPPHVREQKPSWTWSRLSMDTWFWEVISIIFSLACFIAIFVMFLVYDQEPLPNFPHQLSLNTIISVLSMGCKSALLCIVATSIGQLRWIWFQEGEKRGLHHLQALDEATRGPLGSFLYLTKRPYRGQILLSFGAVVTILALAFEPFMQQIIQYPVRLAASSSEAASVKKAVFPYTPTNISIPDSFINALYRGIYDDTFDVPPICSSGNCTWPEFESMGWCSTCEDVTSSASLAGCNIASVNTSYHGDQTLSCNISLPDGNWVKNDITTSWNGTLFGGRLTMVLQGDSISMLNGQPGPYVNKTILGVDSPFIALAYAKIHAPWVGSWTKDLQAEYKIRNVTECVLSMCARNYTTSMSNGVISLKRSSPDYGELFTHDIGNNETINCWKPGNGGPVDIGEPIITSEGVDTSAQWVNASESAICPVTWNEAYTFADFLTGSYPMSLFYNASRQSWYVYSSGGGQTPALQRTNSLQFSKMLEYIADSWTQYARNNNNTVVHGTAYESETYISINWAYLSLPVIVLVLGILFFLLTVLVNRMKRIGLWKTSILPLIYHGPAEEIPNDEYKTVSAMHHNARSMNIKLQYSEAKQRMVLQN